MGGNVISLEGFAGAMRMGLIGEVEAYWEALRAGRHVPMRAEVDPRGIERALEHAFILERIAPQMARFRLAGMHLADLMGMEVRGMPLTSFFTPAARAAVGEALETVFQSPAIAEMALAAETGFGRAPMSGRMILLPLRSDLGDVSRALGCLVAEGPVGRAPRRFGITNLRLRPIAAVGPAPARAAPPLRAPRAMGLSEAPAPYAAAPRPPVRAGGGRPHLRLVKND
jgi:hypothetical protein